ncbi:MAG TPA: DUF58 domain-containing protein [Micromonosporaceae bacterium]|jgi:uncharacterized protein (DUF58 family)
MPTRRGVTVLLAGLVLSGIGYGFGYPELVALGVVAVVVFLAALGAAGSRPSVVVERTAEPRRVARGGLCTAVVTVCSTTRWRRQVLVGEERIRHGDTPAASVPVPLIRLRAGARSFLRYPLPSQRRGIVEVGPVELSRRDPLGLVAATRRYGGVERVWVHPRTHPLRTVPVGASRSLDGVVDAAQYGSITFHALREYVPGDDLRHVHWRTSAHVGELMVREHVETSLPRILVLVDDRAAAHPVTTTVDSLEETMDAAASVVLAGLRAGLHVELHLVSGRSVTPQAAGSAVTGRGTSVPVAGAGPYLDLLTEAQRTPGASLPAAVHRLRARHRGDTLVLLTGSQDGGDLEHVARLRDVYPTVVAGVFGEGRPLPGVLPGVILISVRTAAEFPARWDGVSRW